MGCFVAAGAPYCTSRAAATARRDVVRLTWNPRGRLGRRYGCNAERALSGWGPALPVSDERRAVAFLEEVLGCSELRHEGQGLGIVRREPSRFTSLYEYCRAHGAVHVG